MYAEPVSVQKLFSTDRRQYRVPFFQRAYVWDRENQWERLWGDICDKADARTQGDTPTPHFLGAIVLEPQKKDTLFGVEMVNIIDGQQRLTTLQYFLVALTMTLRKELQTTLLAIVDACLRNNNPDAMQDPETEVFKVWPTFRDRDHFQRAMVAASPSDLRQRFPSSFTLSGTLKKIGINHPSSLEAIWYFAEQIEGWVSGDGDGSKPLRINALTEAVLGDLQIISISLGERDDPQIIFETLNGRGAQLHATDLIRNFIFMRVNRNSAEADKLFTNLWRPFESSFWREPQRRGRLNKPRMEWFLQTALQAVTGDEVEIGRLYANYQRYAAGHAKPIGAADQLATLHVLGERYHALVRGEGDSPIARFGRRMALWDASTTHSLALMIANSGLSDEAQTSMFDDLTSYFVRRAICRLPAKNYNKVFLQQVKKLAAGELTPPSLRASLAELGGGASRWPRDEEVRKALLAENVYPGGLDAPRTRAVLSEIEAVLRPPQTEEPVPSGLATLDIEHILPISWRAHWPLPDGSLAQDSEINSIGLTFLFDEAKDPRLIAIKRREDAKRTIGNLSLVHYGANRSYQNREFAVKREKLFEVSNLHLNRMLMLRGTWDEAAIAERGELLVEAALKIWRGPKV